MKKIIKKYKFMIIAILILVTLLIGGTYAWVTMDLFGEKVNRVGTGDLIVDLDESTCTEINLSNSVPIMDKEGMKLVSCDFSIKNDSISSVSYRINLDDAEITNGLERMDDSFVKFGLEKNSEVVAIDLLSNTYFDGNRMIYSTIISPNTTDTFSLRLWVDYYATDDAIDKVVATKLRVNVDFFRESGCLDIPSYGGIANPPELVDGMIPVSYDKVNNTWVKTDTNNSNNIWYDYDNQKWANIVTVKESVRSNYLNVAVGTVIPMDDINTFMVWIPRYSYTLKDDLGVQGCKGAIPDLKTPGAFDIKFVTEEITEIGTASYTGEVASEWYTHPSFCEGSECNDSTNRLNNIANDEVAGIWISKFKVSTTDEVCNSSSSVENCNKIMQLESKPGEVYLRNINQSNAFYSIINNINGSSGLKYYGLSGDDYDAFMMKNTDWGAIAYLSQSRYGKYGNSDYAGSAKEVAGNNCSNYITGVGDLVNASNNVTSCNTNTYDTLYGQYASTTGTIYGIYDLVSYYGEMVMGNISTSYGDLYLERSGFTGNLDESYYDKYDYVTSSSDLSKAIIGDATAETAGFYSDRTYFATDDGPWFVRSKYDRGLFSFSGSTGNTDSSTGFRFVIK